MTSEKLLESLRFRYATKQFDATKKIQQAEWEALEHSLVLTPSSFGLQPWKFLVIDSPELRADLRAKSWGQSQITDASHLVVFTTRTDMDEDHIGRFFTALSEHQGRSLESLAGYRKVVSGFAAGMSQEARHAWNIRQTYIALGQFMTSAAVLGIDTCPLEGLEPAGYDEVLGLAGSGYATTMACAAGYRSADDNYASVPKSRFPLAEVIEHR